MPRTGPASGSSPAGAPKLHGEDRLQEQERKDLEELAKGKSSDERTISPDNFEGNVAGASKDREAKASEQTKRKRVEDWAAVLQEDLASAMKDSGIVNFEVHKFQVHEVSWIATFSDKNARQEYQVELTYGDAYPNTQQPFAALLPDSSKKHKRENMKTWTLADVLKDIKDGEKQPENKKIQS